MKCFVLCVCILVSLQSFSSAKIKERARMKNIEEDVSACMTELNIKNNDIYTKEEILSNVYTQTENEKKTKKNGCLISCIMKKMNVMQESIIKEEEFLSRLPDIIDDADKARSIIQKCLEEVKNITPECEKGLYIAVCLVKSVHESHHENHEQEQASQEQASQEQVSQASQSKEET